MSVFDKAVQVVLVHEGGLVDNKKDPGGVTNFGVSLRYVLDAVKRDGHLSAFFDFDHSGIVNADDIRKMTRDDAVRVYKTMWWDAQHYERLVDQQVATKVFDSAVNMGPSMAHKLAQRATNDLGYKLVEDGNLGPLSCNAINACSAREWLLTYCMRLRGFYDDLVKQHPDFAGFIDGWHRRANWPFGEPGAYVA